MINTSNLGVPTYAHGLGHGHNHGAGHTVAVSGDDTGSKEGYGFVFKLVTTKGPLVLSAPSEAEEIKWLSAVRAVIARRNGLVPGNNNDHQTKNNTTSVHGSKIGTGVGGGHARNETS